jgi:hypothetical protein
MDLLELEGFRRAKGELFASHPQSPAFATSRPRPT